MQENLMMLKTEDNEYRTIMTGYTKAGGIVQIITDNPYLSVIIEYNSKGSVIGLDTQFSPGVKEE